MFLTETVFGDDLLLLDEIGLDITTSRGIGKAMRPSLALDAANREVYVAVQNTESDLGYQLKSVDLHEHRFRENMEDFVSPPTNQQEHAGLTVISLSSEQGQNSSNEKQAWEDKSRNEEFAGWKGMLNQKEEQFDKISRRKSRKVVDSDSEFDGWKPEDIASSNLSDFSSASEVTNTAEREYYDAIGEVNLFRERIYNFESEHQGKVYERDAKRKMGEALEPPDDKMFYERHLQERGVMILKYSAAKQHMEHLRSECLGLGLEIEEPDQAPFVDQPIELQDSTYFSQELFQKYIDFL